MVLFVILFDHIKTVASDIKESDKARIVFKLRINNIVVGIRQVFFDCLPVPKIETN